MLFVCVCGGGSSRIWKNAGARTAAAGNSKTMFGMCVQRAYGHRLAGLRQRRVAGRFPRSWEYDEDIAWEINEGVGVSLLKAIWQIGCQGVRLCKVNAGGTADFRKR